jgi:hypothetical protein
VSKEDASSWAGVVQGVAAKRGLQYDPVGGLNPVGGPVALCPGGTNRVTGQLAPDSWGAACDADEQEIGGFFSKTVLPAAVMVKAHMPDLAQVMPAFNVESVERNAEELAIQRVARKVEFESIDFNKRFLATVPREYDPVALRELFSPGFLEWVVAIDREVDFGVLEKQIYFHWRLRERTPDEYESALGAGAELFRRVRNEMDESGLHTYPAGPWHAGLEPFPPENVPGSTL